MGCGACSGLDNCSLSPAHQALDGTFNEENRERCRTATAPLIEAMDNLTAFASNPEFATVPAQISSEVGCRRGREEWPACGGSCCRVGRSCMPQRQSLRSVGWDPEQS